MDIPATCIVFVAGFYFGVFVFALLVVSRDRNIRGNHERP